jgi:signal transduction histidine kinase
MPKIMLIECKVNFRDEGFEEINDFLINQTSGWEEVTDAELNEIQNFIYNYNNNHPTGSYLVMKTVPVQMFEIRAKIAQEKERLRKNQQEAEERRAKEAIKREQDKKEQEERRRINKIEKAKKLLESLEANKKAS